MGSLPGRMCGVVMGMAVAALPGPLAQGQDYPLRDAVPHTVRGGLPNVAAKLRAGGTVRLGYLGGSITAQPGWRVQTLEWFRASHPTATVSEINAAIGGTGSDLGVFRLQQDVLQHRPDLLFVEFAVNDGGAPPDRILKAMEGIVRQTWLADPATDICFVYTLTQGMLKDLQGGKYPRAASVMEELADFYGIPSIHMGLEVARLEAAGKVVFSDPKNLPAAERLEARRNGITIFSTDGVHPHPDTGHILYLEAVVRAMADILPAGQPGPHRLAEPLRPDNWEKAKLVPLSAAMRSGDWRRLEPAADGLGKQFAQRLPELWFTETPGAAITFRFSGTVARVYDLVGPRCGAVKVVIDGQERGTQNRFDSYCTYYRLQTMGIGGDLEPGVHTVRLELQPDLLDKRRILEGRAGPNRAVLDLDEAAFAERFTGTHWYVGMLMILGDIVE